MSTCPKWCVTDHETPRFSDGSGFSTHMSARITIQPAGQVARISVNLAVGSRATAPPAVNVHTAAYGDPVRTGFLAPDDPEALALMVEVLAGATPEQHRQLADAIRETAVLETETEPEAGA